MFIRPVPCPSRGIIPVIARRWLVPLCLVGWGAVAGLIAAEAAELKQIKAPPEPDAGQVIALVGGRLIDGRGGEPIENSVVVVQGSRIVAAGGQEAVTIPPTASRIDVSGSSVLPGLIDTHFHSQNDIVRPIEYELKRGITTFRDPGHPFRFYDAVKGANRTFPRIFLCGAHLDAHPPAYPDQAIVIEDAEHARRTVQAHVEGGASAIKIYMRLPVEHIAAACAAANQLGVAVTAHLELVDADQAIGAGVRGIEHITSFGTVLADPAVAAKFKAAVGAESNARRELRHWLWSTLDLENSPRTKPLIDLLVREDVFVSPTLAVFEKRAGEKKASATDAVGFVNMVKFTGMCRRGGAKVVVGSHTSGPHAEVGRAYQRELELLIDAGLSPLEVITAATQDGALFLGVGKELGTIESGKLADLIVVEGDPSRDIQAMRKVQRVMLNGVWQQEPVK